MEWRVVAGAVLVLAIGSGAAAEGSAQLEREMAPPAWQELASRPPAEIAQHVFALAAGEVVEAHPLGTVGGPVLGMRFYTRPRGSPLAGVCEITVSTVYFRSHGLLSEPRYKVLSSPEALSDRAGGPAAKEETDRRCQLLANAEDFIDARDASGAPDASVIWDAARLLALALKDRRFGLDRPLFSPKMMTRVAERRCPGRAADERRCFAVDVARSIAVDTSEHATILIEGDGLPRAVRVEEDGLAVR